MPARNDREMQLPLAVNSGALVTLYGDDGFDSEQVVGFETGYRIQPQDGLAFDVAAFYNLYEDLRGATQGAAFLDGDHWVLPFTYGNHFRGQSYGAELMARWEPQRHCRLEATYAWCRTLLQSKTPGATSYSSEGDSPWHQVGLRLTVDLPGRCELGGGVRWVDALKAQSVPSYWAGDVRLAWRPNAQWELAVVGQQLAGNHREIGPCFVTRPEAVPASVYAQFTWRY
jgi:iron complex outermembrane receptor protein